MNKISFVFLLTVFLFFTRLQPASAQVVTIGDQGEIAWKVLGDETSNNSGILNSSIEVKKVGNAAVNSKPTISLSKDGENVSLSVISGNETRNLDVLGDDKNLVEVEERPYVQKVIIGVQGDKFSLTQGGITALTDFPINVDARAARFSVKTGGGMEYIFVLPKEAVDTALNSRLITSTDSDITITSDRGEVAYRIAGEKVFNFFDLFKYTIPVTTYVSASSGKLTSIDSPTWFRFLKFLFI